jgi:Fic family protein
MVSLQPSQFDRSERAGRYVRQTTGYRAFIPAPLPPDPPIAIDAEMQHWLSDADRALGRLDGSIQTLPNPNLFVMMYTRKEAVLSSQIEGTQASISDLLKAEADLFHIRPSRDVSEVRNYVAAMNLGLQRLPDLPISIRLIKEIHGRLMQGVRGHHQQPGETRLSQNWIGPSGSTILSATYIPPPHIEAEQALGELEKFIHASDHLPLLIRIGLIHAQFETIHPFLDGNGRVGRLLITLFLCSKHILQKPVLYLSHYFKANQQEYYERLQRVRDQGDWEGWLKFFLQGVGTVAGQATETARKIVALRENHRQLIIDRMGSSCASAIKLIEHLYNTPSTTVNAAKDFLGISYPNANNLIVKLCENEILFEVTGQSRNRLFFYSPYIELFSEIGA